MIPRTYTVHIPDLGSTLCRMRLAIAGRCASPVPPASLRLAPST